MKNKPFIKVFYITFIVVVATACNKKFDEPPTSIEPDISPTLSIRELLNQHITGNIDKLTDDDIIEAVVIADDKSGNFYKQLVLQDSTAGIVIKLDGFNLYTDFPVGRKLYIKLKGLYLGDYNKSIQLGGGIDNSNPASLSVTPVASNLFDQYIIKASLNNNVTPVVITPDELGDLYQNRLVKLEDYQFAAIDTAKTYADKTQAASAVNFSIRNCSNKSITLRTSSYADFAGINVPNGNGSIVAVYAAFGNTKQLYIRDTSDVQFNKERCGATTGTIINITDLRAMYKGTPVAIPDGTRIKGIVISDKDNGNISSRNLIVQQGNNMAGIMLRFTDMHKYVPGDEIEADLSGLALQEYNGNLQVDNMPLENIIKTGSGTIAPRVATISQLLTNFEAWESTLVSIQEVKISNGTNGTWLGNTLLTDASGSITCNTTAGAAFSNNSYPSGTVSSFTGILMQNNAERQCNIRNTKEIITGTTNVNQPDLMISEYVEGSASNKYLELYNAGTSAADLSKYTLKLYKNGSASASSSVRLNTLGASAMLAAGALLVLKNNSAKLTLPSGITAYATGICAFNGDDAITLEKDAVLIDVFGEPGKDPGTSWTINGDSKACIDKSLRRKKDILKGGTNWNNVAAEWTVINTKDDVSDLGKR